MTASKTPSSLARSATCTVADAVHDVVGSRQNRVVPDALGAAGMEDNVVALVDQCGHGRPSETGRCSGDQDHGHGADSILLIRFGQWASCRPDGTPADKKCKALASGEKCMFSCCDAVTSEGPLHASP